MTTGHDSDFSRERAADWLQRLDQPRLNERDIQDWVEWFGASDANRKAFEEMQGLRRRLRALPSSYREDLKRRTGTAFVGASLVGENLRETLGLAAPAAATRAIGLRRQTYWALAASLGAVALGAGIWWKTQTGAVATYAAPAEHHRTVTLEDGSLLVLGAEAVVDVLYSHEQRSLKVQHGEAYFEVRPDSSRPFVVRAGEIRVRALGTAFNVQRGSDKVTVTVTEGKVAVSSGSSETKPAHRSDASPSATTLPAAQREMLLSMGQRAVVSLNPVVHASPSQRQAPLGNWGEDHADFINAPLSDVIPIINRYAAAKLVIDDPRVRDLTYSGTIFHKHIDEWVASLPKVYQIRTVPLEDGTVSIVSRTVPDVADDR